MRLKSETMLNLTMDQGTEYFLEFHRSKTILRRCVAISKTDLSAKKNNNNNNNS